VKPVERDIPSTGSELIEVSLGLLRRHLELVPRANPFHAFERRFRKDLAWLVEEPIEAFHDYAFATLRQYGACFELVETYLTWLADGGEQGLDEAIEAFHAISTTAKTFQFQLARALARRRELGLEPLRLMAEQWERGIGVVMERYGEGRGVPGRAPAAAGV
jgi:hypothetical protein